MGVHNCAASVGYATCLVTVCAAPSAVRALRPPRQFTTVLAPSLPHGHWRNCTHQSAMAMPDLSATRHLPARHRTKSGCANPALPPSSSGQASRQAIHATVRAACPSLLSPTPQALPRLLCITCFPDVVLHASKPRASFRPIRSRTMLFRNWAAFRSPSVTPMYRPCTVRSPHL